ncbi:MAG: Rrf2 family transcriptional regulator [Chloroflexi bacterium]|nr:Rrf2 family transcriptional regulator [Chloroflexota bacterium]
MLQVSERAHYGLRAMTELAKAYGDGPLTLNKIAEVEHMPAGYLEQLAMPLRRAGLIEGRRGAHGGYQLARDPASVTIGSIMRALEGPVAPVECLTEQYVVGTCEREIGCASQGFWQRMKLVVDQAMDSVTLADLCAPGMNGAFIPLSQITQVSRSPSDDVCAPVGMGEQTI